MKSWHNEKNKRYQTRNGVLSAASRCIFNGLDFISSICKSKPSIVKMKSELLIAEINNSDAALQEEHLAGTPILENVEQV